VLAKRGEEESNLKLRTVKDEFYEIVFEYGKTRAVL